MRYTDQLRDLAQLIEDENLPVPIQLGSYGTQRVVTTVVPRTEEREPWLELCESIEETQTNADTWFVKGVVNYSADFKFEVHATWSAPPCVDPACPHHGTEKP